MMEAMEENDKYNNNDNDDASACIISLSVITTSNITVSILPLLLESEEKSDSSDTFPTSTYPSPLFPVILTVVSHPPPPKLSAVVAYATATETDRQVSAFCPCTKGMGTSAGDGVTSCGRNVRAGTRRPEVGPLSSVSGTNRTVERLKALIHSVVQRPLAAGTQWS